MILIKNDKHFKLIGYEESSLTQSILLYTGTLGFKNGISVISPADFRTLENKDQYQYMITIGVDFQERKEMVDIVEENNLDCVTYVQDSSLVHETAKLGKGVAVFSFNLIMANAVIGNHCIIDAYCLVGHDTIVGNNCTIRPGTLIAGKTTIGNNCLFNMKAGVINKINICDDVVIGAFSNVTKTISQPGMYVGTPARLVKSAEVEHPLG